MWKVLEKDLQCTTFEKKFSFKYELNAQCEDQTHTTIENMQNAIICRLKVCPKSSLFLFSCTNEAFFELMTNLIKIRTGN